MRVEQKSFFIGNMKADENQQQKNAFPFGKGLVKQENPIEIKRREAQEQAKKIVQDVATKEYAMDEELVNRSKRIDTLRTEMQTEQEKYTKVEEMRNAFRDEYGVPEDSQEQKDLELLEKNVDASLIPPKATLTKEEEERLLELKDKPMTEYQERMLNAYKEQNRIQGAINGLQEEAKIEIATIKAINGERLKTHSVVDATKQAEIVMKAASKEIQGMIIDEAKEKVEEDIEKIKEDAEKKIEEEKNQQEKLEKLKEKIAKMEEILEKLKEADEAGGPKKITNIQELSVSESDIIREVDNRKAEIQKEIDSLMEKMKLIGEDMKGVMVDFKR